MLSKRGSRRPLSWADTCPETSPGARSLRDFCDGELGAGFCGADTRPETSPGARSLRDFCDVVVGAGFCGK